MRLNQETDFLSAMSEYISFITGLSESVILRGNQSRSVLPRKNEYCIYTPILRSRRGTNVYNFNADNVDDDTNAPETYTGSVIATIQIDFYGKNADRYAQGVETTSKSAISNKFLRDKGYDMSVIGCSDPRDLTGLDASDQYVSRWTVDLLIEFDSAISQDIPWFEDYHFNVIKEVDTSFNRNIRE